MTTHKSALLFVLLCGGLLVAAVSAALLVVSVLFVIPLLAGTIAAAGAVGYSWGWTDGVQ